MFDGNNELRKLTKKAGYKSLASLVAEHTLFTHPKTVELTNCKNLFRIIRNAGRRGKIVKHIDHKDVMYCDNEGPNRAFVWANNAFKYSDVQFNHIYSDSQNVNIYTSLANLCVTPAFIAKLTDTDKEIVSLLKYRAYDLYGFFVGIKPDKPEVYDQLHWKSFINPIDNLERYFVERMNKAKKCRSAISSRKIGWYFSEYQPDSRLLE